jgi:hypothetical protein
MYIRFGAPDETKLRTSLFFRWNLDCGFLGIWDRWPARFLIGRAEPTFGAHVCDKVGADGEVCLGSGRSGGAIRNATAQ